MIRAALVRVWAFPYTVIGLLIGLFGLLSGGQGRLHTGVFEFHGGLVTKFLDCLPLPHVLGFTLGHTVLGRSDDALEITRDHERVHVRQYERWGPMMGPAYIGCSAVLWLQGKDAYRGNPFEKEAYAEAPTVKPYRDP